MARDPAPRINADEATGDATAWNFGALLGQGVFSQVGYKLTSPGMVLPFLYTAVGAPLVFAGLLLPMYKAAKLLAGLVSAPLVGASLRRKWYVALAFTVAAVALVIVALASKATAIVVVALVFVIGAVVTGGGGGLSSVAYQDLLGRTLPGHRRRDLLSIQAALAGVVTVLIALVSQRELGAATPLERHLELLWMGIVGMALAGILAITIREAPPAKTGDGPAPGSAPAHGRLRDHLGRFRPALQVPWFRRYLIAAALFLSVDLSIPFYAMHAASMHSGNHRSLGAFVIATSIGIAVGGVIWRSVGKVSVRAVFVLAAVVACAAGGLALFIDLSQDDPPAWLHAGVFLLLSMATIGLGNARMLYVIGHSTDDERPFFVAVGNTLLGILGVGVALGFGMLAHLQGVVWPIWLIIGVTLVAAISSRWLIESPPKDDAETQPRADRGFRTDPPGH